MFLVTEYAALNVSILRQISRYAIQTVYVTVLEKVRLKHFSNHLAEEERADRFTLIASLLLCCCTCSGSSLPHNTLGWAAVCDCSVF